MAELVEGFTVREAADSLGLSRQRVQQMIGNKQITAEEIGNQWIIPRHEIFRSKRIPRIKGRPYTADSCWAIIDELDDGRRPLSWLRDNWYMLETRAEHVTGRALPDVLGEIYDDRRIIVGGSHAASVAGAPTRERTPPVDIYIAQHDAAAYRAAIGLRAVTAEPNITMHIVSSERWGQLGRHRTVNLVVAYLDLMEAGDRAAGEVLGQLSLR